jgi:hypothetical protein
MITTVAGEALMDCRDAHRPSCPRWVYSVRDCNCDLPSAILAIETEAQTLTVKAMDTLLGITHPEIPSATLAFALDQLKSNLLWEWLGKQPVVHPDVRAENERLRAALRQIRDDTETDLTIYASKCEEIARAALEELTV